MTLAHWRDIAMLLLVIEALLGSTLILILTLLLASIVRRTTSALSDLLRQGQVHAARLAQQTEEISHEQIVSPVVRIHAAHAGARAFLQTLARGIPFPHR